MSEARSSWLFSNFFSNKKSASSDQLNNNPTDDAAKKNEERFTIKIIERRYKSRDAVDASRNEVQTPN